MAMLECVKTNILYTTLTTVAAIVLTSCGYGNFASAPLNVGEINIGMSKEAVIDKFGQPFSFCANVSDRDTITVLSYKTPKPVANCEFVVTTRLRFVNNTLKTISQSDFYVPKSVIYCDSTKALSDGSK